MPSVEWNRSVWDRDYAWPAHGDEWTQQAEFCGVPYEKWKESLARTFLIPYLKESSQVLEIGPGHGRWTNYIQSRIPKGYAVLIDLSQTCLDYCKKRFPDAPLRFYANDGKTLPGSMLLDSIDFIWSFDTFVHIEEPEIRAYAKAFFKVLKTHGMGVIHHAGTPTPEQRASGARSLVGARLFGDIFREAGFFVIRQTSEWDGGNLKMTGDSITVFVKA